MLRRLFGRGDRDADDPTGERARVDLSTGRAPQSGRAPAVEAALRLAAANRAIGDRYLAETDLRALPAVAAVLDGDEAVRAAALLQLVDERLGTERRPGTYALLSMLARRRVVLPATETVALLDRFGAGLGGPAAWHTGTVVEMVVPVIERSVAALPSADRARAEATLAGMVTAIEAKPTVRVKPAAMQRLRALVGRPVVDLDAISADDEVGAAARTIVEASTEEPDALGPFLVQLTTPAKGGRPTANWLADTARLGGALRDARGLVRAVLAAAADAGDGTVVYDYTDRDPRWGRVEMARFVGEKNEAFLRNVTWAAAALRDAEAVPLLRALAQKCIVVIGGEYGHPRSLTVAMACPGAIAAIGAPASLTALQGLQRAIRHGSVLREIGKAIDTLAASAQVSRSELLETAVERHDLDPDARREIAVGDWLAIVAVDTGGSVTTTWRGPTGRSAASLPKAVRDEHRPDAGAVTAAVKAIRDTVAAERVRLDRLFLEDRRWPIATWRERYLGHPITGALTRGLVWRFVAGGGPIVGLPDRAGQSVTDAGGVTHPVPDEAEVELWHPIGATQAEVQAWRERVLGERIRQPLKQAFRELYVVTPAEEQTGTYSNRFASHIIRQVQARALMKGRGWAPVAVAWWDDGIDQGISRRTIEAHGIRVEFFYDPITDIQPTGGDLWPYCSTDQVRFFDVATDRAMAVGEVPRIAFSEVMRDVDLFVGVTTIGADPEWLDRGERRFDRYWHTWGFGELGQPATVRREVLASILPALTIADRCTLGDRYLEVRGDLRTYKIHVGSGNILMSPADQYLCIVATRHPADDRTFLPFDDDPMLSLILSKAFMLANDRAISDPTILRQMANS